jgi:hypothetical protein
MFQGNNAAVNGSDSSSDSGSSNQENIVATVNLDLPIAEISATRFYKLVDHPIFGLIAELKPIVLKMPDGEIVRKIMWSENSHKFDSSYMPGSPSIHSEDGVIPSPASSKHAVSQSISSADEDQPVREINHSEKRPSDYTPIITLPTGTETDKDDDISQELHASNAVFSTEEGLSTIDEESENIKSPHQKMKVPPIPPVSTSEQVTEHPNDGTDLMSEISRARSPPLRRIPSISVSSERGTSSWREEIMSSRAPERRCAENDLVVMTDRGVQFWNLGVWARGKREKGELDAGLIGQESSEDEDADEDEGSNAGKKVGLEVGVNGKDGEEHNPMDAAR